MLSYQKLLYDVMENGTPTSNRTGVDTITLWGYQWRHTMREGFPLLTTKKLHLKSIVAELLWIIHGRTDNKFLTDQGVNIWTPWVKPDGTLGPVYGAQLRGWYGCNGINDQLADVLRLLRKEPDTRRAVVSYWQPSELHAMAIPPCHYSWQVRIIDETLNMHVTMRSADAFLGLPFDIAHYAFLLEMLAQDLFCTAGELVFSIADLHLYGNHWTQAMTQRKRLTGKLPVCILPQKTIFEQTQEGLENSIHGYIAEPHIPAPIAI